MSYPNAPSQHTRQPLLHGCTYSCLLCAHSLIPCIRSTAAAEQLTAQMYNSACAGDDTCNLTPRMQSKLQRKRLTAH